MEKKIPFENTLHNQIMLKIEGNVGKVLLLGEMLLVLLIKVKSQLSASPVCQNFVTKRPVSMNKEN